MAIDQSYWTKLAQENGASQEEMDAFQKVLANPNVSKAIADRVLAKEDYSRNMDRIRQDEARVKQLEKQNVDWWNNEAPKFNKAQELLKNYVETYGELPNDGTRPQARAQVVDGKYISAEQHQKAISELWSVQKEVMKAAAHYQATFGRPLPPEKYDELEELARKPENLNRPVRDVYKDFISEELTTKSKADTDAEIQRRVDEQVKERMSKVNFPSEEVKKEVSPLFSRPDPKTIPQGDRDLRQSFAQDFREAAVAKT